MTPKSIEYEILKPAALRLGLDYLRYSDPRFAAMPKIRKRAYDRTPVFVVANSPKDSHQNKSGDSPAAAAWTTGARTDLGVDETKQGRKY